MIKDSVMRVIADRACEASMFYKVHAVVILKLRLVYDKSFIGTRICYDHILVYRPVACC